MRHLLKTALPVSCLLALAFVLAAPQPASAQKEPIPLDTYTICEDGGGATIEAAEDHAMTQILAEADGDILVSSTTVDSRCGQYEVPVGSGRYVTYCSVEVCARFVSLSRL